MLVPKQDLVGLVEKSSFLYERRAPCFEFANAPESTIIERRLTEWKRTAAWGDEESFARRLTWDGLTPELALALVSGVRWRDEDATLPGWTQYIEGALEECDEFARHSPESLEETLPFLDPKQPLAFEHLLAPFVQSASKRLHAQVGGNSDLLTAAAWTGLERNLAQWLSAVSAETIDLEFAVFRTLRNAQNSSAMLAFGSLPRRTAYNSFIREMWNGKLLAFLKEYAVLARLLGTLAELWVKTACDFVCHLSKDFPAINQTFPAGVNASRVASLEAGLSDRHHGGRTSLRVVFDNGLELIYKPKNLDSENLYYALLRWLNARGETLDFAVFKGVYRADHGWVEVVPNLPCVDREAVRRYYHRAGMLLCLMYCLEANDCHHENLIASGEYPVLIDMETILQHRVAVVEGSGHEDASATANRVFYWDSVFRTALLPRWEFGPRGESYDISGLGGIDEQVTPFKRKAWQYINTDAMRLKRESIKTQPSRNLVFYEGRKAKPAEFLEELVTGFTSMYRLLTEVHHELFAPGGPLDAMKKLRLRFLYRHTKIYTSVLNSYLMPDYLRDGADTNIQVDILSRPLLHTSARHPFWPMIAVEEACLLQCDVPLFTSTADGTDLLMENGDSIPSFFVEPSFSLLRSRFERLNEPDMMVQVSYLRTCFQAPKNAAPDSSPTVLNGSETLASTDEFAEEALAIACEIARSAIRSNDGSATWITLAYYSEAQRWQLQPMTPRLYDGVCGTVLFLAAAAQLSGDDALRELALGGIKTITDALESVATKRVLTEAGIGAGLGAGSIPYTLIEAASLLNMPELIAKARNAALMLTSDLVHSDHRFDLMGGAAGALLALLSVYRATRVPTMLARAKECGEHLLARRIQEGQAKSAWATLGGSPLTGFSHGVAGIAYALTQLFAATHDGRWLDAAREACLYESATYCAEQGNWPDFRYPKTKNGYVFQNSWCHGAPGIALGRLGGLRYFDDDQVRRDVEHALKATGDESLAQVDHLCCGNMGRVETLLVAAERLGREEFGLRAKKLGTHVLRRARTLGRYGLGSDDGPYVPSFHQGMAGIGYQFLRLSFPERFPCVLLWDNRVQ